MLFVQYAKQHVPMSHRATAVLYHFKETFKFFMVVLVKPTKVCNSTQASQGEGFCGIELTELPDVQRWWKTLIDVQECMHEMSLVIAY